MHACVHAAGRRPGRQAGRPGACKQCSMLHAPRNLAHPPRPPAFPPACPACVQDDVLFPNVSELPLQSRRACDMGSLRPLVSCTRAEPGRQCSSALAVGAAAPDRGFAAVHATTWHSHCLNAIRPCMRAAHCAGDPGFCRQHPAAAGRSAGTGSVCLPLCPVPASSFWRGCQSGR